MNARLDYRADLDGLRAFAVVPVVLYHLGVTLLPGGFVGVDIFFVLSGFLITSLLAVDLESGVFSLTDFYDSRIRRIVPALVLVLLFCTCAAVLILFPNDLTGFGTALAATALGVSNMLFARQSGYFATNADLLPLLHTWSLAVEEQFYIFFPVVLWATWRWTRKLLPSLIWLALASSLALSVWGGCAKPRSTFYLLPTRGWELLVGSVLALRLVPEPNASWQREAGAACGVLAILASMVLYTRDIAFPGMAALMPCLGAALVIWAGLGRRAAESWTAYLLGNRIPVFIGLVSYSLYLWHWPLIVFANHLTSGPLTPLLKFSLTLVTILLAVLSWRFVERPLRAGRWPWPARRHRFLGGGVVLGALVLLGTGIKFARGLPQRIAPGVAELASTSSDFSHLRSRCHADGSARRTFSETCVLGASVPPSIIVFADSHGAELCAALSQVAEERHLSLRQVTASSCPPIVGFVSKEKPECAIYVEAMLSALSSAPPSTVIVAAHYFEWYTGSRDNMLWSGLERTVQALRGAGHSVVLLGAVPPHPHGVAIPSALARWVQFGGTPQDYRFPLDRGAASVIEANLKRIANATGAVYVAVVPYLCPDELGCRAYKNGTVMHFDDNHLSVSGAKLIATDLLVPAIWSRHRN